MPSPAQAAPDVSVVIPVYNEVDSLPQLYRELTDSLAALDRPYEILFVDDGSNDGSGPWLDGVVDTDPHVRVVHLRKNFGKSPALGAAFERVGGRIVLTLDADLQDDPAMIPRFIERIEAGADLVSGWKRERHDPMDKVGPSRVFNAVVGWVSGVPLDDFNCGFKAYRIECIRELSVYGGLHRFLPVLAAWKGFAIEQLVVNHRPRQHGVSKFGAGRLFDGFFDLLTVLMVTRYRTRPLHFFGGLGALFGGVGLSLLTYLSVLWFMGHPIGHRPLLILGVLLTLAAIQFIGIGLVGELLVRTTIDSHEVYSIRATRGFPAEPPALPSATRGFPAEPPALPSATARPLAEADAPRPALHAPSDEAEPASLL